LQGVVVDEAHDMDYSVQRKTAFHLTTRSGPQGYHKEVAESHISLPF